MTSGSEGVDVDLERLIDRHRRDSIGRQIVEGYLRQPQTDHEIGWAEQSAARMIADEPWCSAEPSTPSPSADRPA